MSQLILPPSLGSQPFVANGFDHSRNRRFLKYAVQVRDDKAGQIIKCLTVSVDVSGGMPPPAIKRRLTEKVINFIAQAYPGQLNLRGIVVGRIDLEI